jgi:hypothetical protein
MRRTWSAGLGLFLASFLFAANPRECVDLSARQDNDVSSPSGIRVMINGYNRCSEDIDGGATHFRVNVIGASGAAIARQSGRFGGTIRPGGRVETLVFVVCDPERVRSITVEAQ